MTDPRYTDPPVGDLLGWIVGIAAIVLIAFVIVFAGSKHGTNAASDKPLATTESAPNSGIKPPNTTGFGGSSPQPMSPPTWSGQPLPPIPE
jgi:hypothetical protein